MKKIFLSCCMILFTLLVFRVSAQPTFDFGADLMSRYIWRGLNAGGTGPSIQPSAVFGLNSKNGKHAFVLGAWGAYTFGPTSNQEVDLYVSYTFNELFSLTVTDYFFPGLNTGEKNDYFVYSADSTGHVYEGMISFNGTKKVPVTLMFAMNFYGNDARKVNDDGTLGSIVMSKYLEVGYKHSFKAFDINPFVGFALTKPDTAFAPVGYYLNDKAGCINVGLKATKEIKITDHYSLPVQCSLIANPMQSKFYFVFGITI